MTGDFDLNPQPVFNPVQPCPSCGHCPTCGRGPVYWNPIPYWSVQMPFVVPCTTSGGETATVRFGAIS